MIRRYLTHLHDAFASREAFVTAAAIFVVALAVIIPG